MKLLRCIVSIACLLTAPFAHAGERPTAKVSGAAARASENVPRAYETAEQIKAMPRCKATADERSPCSVRLSTADGRKIYIGSPGATKEVAAFLPTLKDGHTYTLPDAFLDFRKNHK